MVVAFVLGGGEGEEDYTVRCAMAWSRTIFLFPKGRIQGGGVVVRSLTGEGGGVVVSKALQGLKLTS